MARSGTLNFRTISIAFAIGVGAGVISFASLRGADQPMMEAAKTAPVPPAGPVAAAKTPATNAPAVLPPPDTFGRYGKILTTSEEMNYPLRLKMPFPGVGEVKVPTPDEWTMREKLEELSKHTDDEIRAELAQWPAFNHMSLKDEGTMLSRIQDFREYHAKVALQKAHDMGLLTMTDDQRAHFEKEYWDKRLQLDRDLIKQFTPIFKARQQKMEDELFRKYSAPAAGPIVQAPKPSAPKPSTPKPPAPTKTAPPAPNVTQNPAATTNVTQPMAQAPK